MSTETFEPSRRGYFRRFRPYRARVVAALVLSIVQAALLLPIPILIGISIDEAIPDENTGQLLLLSAGMAVCAALSVLAQIAARAVDLRATMDVSRHLRYDVYEKLIKLPRSTYDKTSVTDLHDRVVNDTLRIQTMTSVMITTMLPTAVLSVGLCIVLFSLDWKLTLVTFAFAPIMFLAGRVLTSRIRDASDVFHPAYRDFSARALLMLRSQDVIRLAGAEAQELEQADQQLEHLRVTNQRVAYLSSMNPAIQQGVIAVAGAALLLAGGLSVINTDMTVGGLLSFYAGFAMLRGPAGGLAQSFSQVVEGQQALDRIQALLADPLHRPYTGTEQVDINGHLRLDDVTFGYDPERPVVRHASLELAPGRIVALIGPNGSGKSSLVNLLLGFYRPTSGEVTAEGRPYDELDMRTLRPQLGVVTQEPFLFPGTVRANIVYGKEWTDAELDRALQLSGADLVIERLPAGLDTEIGDDGVRLSGGQRQRIAIARALLGEPRVLIFDEPTNHLDQASINALLANLRQLRGADQLAVLIVSHNDGVLEGADLTVAMDNGEIVWRSDDSPQGSSPSASPAASPSPYPVASALPPRAAGPGPTHYEMAVRELHADGVLNDTEADVIQSRVGSLHAPTQVAPAPGRSDGRNQAPDGRDPGHGDTPAVAAG